MVDPDITALMEWAIPTPTRPTPCKHGHTPELCQTTYRDRHGEAEYRYESRKWFGLLACCIGPPAYDEGEYAAYKAAKKWNRTMGRDGTG